VAGLARVLRLKSLMKALTLNVADAFSFTTGDDQYGLLLISNSS
jgi:hypothetical protein